MESDSGRAVVTVEEAGRILGIGRSSAFAAVHRGEIPVLRIGRRILVPRAALERMLAEPPAAAPEADAGERP